MKLFKKRRFNIEKIHKYSEFIKIPKNSVIDFKNYEANCLLSLIDGEIAVEEIIDEERLLIATLKFGDYIGEFSFLSGGSRLATCRSITDIECLLITRKQFELLLKNEPKKAIRLIIDIDRKLIGKSRKINRIKNNFSELTKNLTHQLEWEYEKNRNLHAELALLKAER